jgi:hypothetical protein
MSHFTVLVIGDNPEAQLEPYQENNMGDCPKEYMTFNDIEANERADYLAADKDIKKKYPTFEEYIEDYVGYKKDEKTGKYGYWSNPNAKWDWYTLGGRWHDFFKLKQGTSGYKGTNRSDEKEKDGYADSAQMKDIDFKGMCDDAAKEAAERYRKLERLLGGTIPTIISWEEISDEKGAYRSIDIDKKRELYHGQAAKKAVVLAGGAPGISKEDKEFLQWLDLEDYQMSFEEYVERAYNSAISTFAVIKDGKWYERGEMGWFGCATNEKDVGEWNKQYTQLLASLPEDTLVSVYDCHT